MKKLVTLSAIALAGATLGVGTTFGWWADDDDDQLKKTKTESAGDVVIQLRSKGGDLSVEEVPGVNKSIKATSGAIVIESEADGKPGKAASEYIRFVQSTVNPSSLEKLADELEQEAKEFEGHGQKEAAAIQRKLAERLRATLKASRSQPKIQGWQTGGKSNKVKEMLSGDKLDKIPNEKIDEHIKQKLDGLRLEFKSRDPEPKKNPDAYLQELKARIQEIEANPKAHEEPEAQLKKLRAAFEQQARLATEKHQDQARHAKAKQLDQVVAQLKEAAEKLEQTGRKEEAREVREKIEHIKRTIEQETSEKPKFEKHEVIVDDKSGKIIRFRKEIKDGEGSEGLAIISVEPKGEVKWGGKEKGPVSEHGVVARIKGDHPAHADGAPLFEVQKMLKELHHEIQELREEVRGLRGLLSDKQVSGKQKVRDDDDKPQGDEGKAYKTITKDPKPKIRPTLKRDGDDDKRDGEKKKPDAEKRDDDDDDEAKSEKRKEKDDDETESEDREGKDDESAQAKRAFNFYIGLMR